MGNIVIGTGKFIGRLVISSIVFGAVMKGSTIVQNKLDKVIDDDGRLRAKNKEFFDNLKSKKKSVLDVK